MDLLFVKNMRLRKHIMSSTCGVFQQLAGIGKLEDAISRDTQPLQSRQAYILTCLVGPRFAEIPAGSDVFAETCHRASLFFSAESSTNLRWPRVLAARIAA